MVRPGIGVGIGCGAGTAGGRKGVNAMRRCTVWTMMVTACAFHHRQDESAGLNVCARRLPESALQTSRHTVN